MADKLVKSPIPFICMSAYIIIVFILAYQQGFSKKARERKKNQTFEDFMTGSKSRNAFVVALVSIVTFYSGTTFTGRVGFFYNYGVAGLSSVVSCSMTGIVMYFLSEKIWPLAKKYRLSTLSDIMELRYQSRLIKFLLSLLTIGFNIIWLITEIRTLGYAMNMASGGVISDKAGSAIAFLIIVLYVSTGGIHSVAIIDSFSACVMLGGSLVVLFYLVGHFFDGNIINVFEAAKTVKSDVFVMNPTGDYGIPYWFSNIFLGTCIMLVYPSNFNGICMARNNREVKKAAIATSASGVWLGIYGIFGAIVLGSVAKGISFSDPQAGILQLCSNAGSPLMLGIVCTFILAASLGTLDSTLIGLAGLLQNDLITNIKKMRRGITPIGAEGDDPDIIKKRVQGNAEREVWITRICVFTLGAIAFGFSLTNLPLLVLLTNIAMNGLAMLVPTIVLGLFWKKATTYGAVTSMILTEAVYLFLYLTYSLEYVNGYFLGVPLMIAGFLIHIVVSLLTYKKFYAEHEAQKQAFRDFYDKAGVAKYIRERM